MVGLFRWFWMTLALAASWGWSSQPWSAETQTPAGAAKDYLPSRPVAEETGPGLHGRLSLPAQERSGLGARKSQDRDGNDPTPLLPVLDLWGEPGLEPRTAQAPLALAAPDTPPVAGLRVEEGGKVGPPGRAA